MGELQGDGFAFRRQQQLTIVFITNELVKIEVLLVAKVWYLVPPNLYA